MKAISDSIVRKKNIVKGIMKLLLEGKGEDEKSFYFQ